MLGVGNLRRYTLYALGEVFLVVVGILLAETSSLNAEILKFTADGNYEPAKDLPRFVRAVRAF